MSRRTWLTGMGATVAALCRWRESAAAQAGDGASPWSAPRAATRELPVAGFDTLDWNAVGELDIRQTGRELLTVTAEPQVLDKIVAQVRGHTLYIAFAPGIVQTRALLRFQLEVKTLASIVVDGSGTANVGALDVPSLSLQLQGSVAMRIVSLRAASFDAQIEGSGGLQVSAGAVQRQRVVISGAADYIAPSLASRVADVSVEGSGAMQLAVAERLVARIDGSGDVSYRGTPRVSQQINGAGLVRRIVGSGGA